MKGKSVFATGLRLVKRKNRCNRFAFATARPEAPWNAPAERGDDGAFELEESTIVAVGLQRHGRPHSLHSKSGVDAFALPPHSMTLPRWPMRRVSAQRHGVRPARWRFAHLLSRTKRPSYDCDHEATETHRLRSARCHRRLDRVFAAAPG